MRFLQGSTIRGLLLDAGATPATGIVVASADYPGIPPTALPAVPFFSTVYARWAIGVAAGYFLIGYLVMVHEGMAPLRTAATLFTPAPGDVRPLGGGS